MDKKELQKIRKVIKSMKNENHTLFIEGENFSCIWNGESFTWYVNGRTYENCTVKEILSWLGNGEYIKHYCYNYVAD